MGGISPGTVGGHVILGIVIALFGLHWALGMGRCLAAGALYSRSWHALPWQCQTPVQFPGEPALKFFTMFMGILGELYFKEPWIHGWDWFWRPLVTGDGARFQYVDSWHHACMQLSFLACGVVELGGFYCCASAAVDSSLLCGVELALLSLALTLLAIMYAMHALGGDGLPAEIHKIQALFFTAAAVAAMSEASNGGRARVAPLVRATAMVGAGAWLTLNGVIYLWMRDPNSAWALDPMAAHVLPVYATGVVYASVAAVAILAGAPSACARGRARPGAHEVPSRVSTEGGAQYAQVVVAADDNIAHQEP